MLDNRAMPGMRGRLSSVTRSLVTTFAIAIGGCATTPNLPPPINVAPQGAIASDQAAGADRGVSGVGVSGVWEGISVSNCEGDPADLGAATRNRKSP